MEIEMLQFEPCQKVLLFNSRMKILLGKLKTHWYVPFVVKEAFLHGAIELYKGDGTMFKLNRHRVKHYKEGIPREETEGEDLVLVETATT